MAQNWSRLVRFIAKEDGQIHYGEVDATKYPDVGLTTLSGETITARLVQASIFDGVVTDRNLTIGRVSDAAFQVV